MGIRTDMHGDDQLGREHAGIALSQAVTNGTQAGYSPRVRANTRVNPSSASRLRSGHPGALRDLAHDGQQRVDFERLAGLDVLQHRGLERAELARDGVAILAATARSGSRWRAPIACASFITARQNPLASIVDDDAIDVAPVNADSGFIVMLPHSLYQMSCWMRLRHAAFEARRVEFAGEIRGARRRSARGFADDEALSHHVLHDAGLRRPCTTRARRSRSTCAAGNRGRDRAVGIERGQPHVRRTARACRRRTTTARRSSR